MGYAVHVGSEAAPPATLTRNPRMIPNDTGIVTKIGVTLLCAYVFVLYSRVLEAFGIGVVTAILLALLIPCIALSGNASVLVRRQRAGMLLQFYDSVL